MILVLDLSQDVILLSTFHYSPFQLVGIREEWTNGMSEPMG